ncbi:hypothetical protein PENTCL1PPCAC_3946, partial [Pristionchus entomophagus]
NGKDTTSSAYVDGQYARPKDDTFDDADDDTAPTTAAAAPKKKCDIGARLSCEGCGVLLPARTGRALVDMRRHSQCHRRAADRSSCSNSVHRWCCTDARGAAAAACGREHATFTDSVRSDDRIAKRPSRNSRSCSTGRGSRGLPAMRRPLIFRPALAHRSV